MQESKIIQKNELEKWTKLREYWRYTRGQNLENIGGILEDIIQRILEVY
jgi:hypothetical protein